MSVSPSHLMILLSIWQCFKDGLNRQFECRLVLTSWELEFILTQLQSVFSPSKLHNIFSWQKLSYFRSKLEIRTIH